MLLCYTMRNAGSTESVFMKAVEEGMDDKGKEQDDGKYHFRRND